MINRVVLTGRLTSDIELKYTQSNKAVAEFNLAVNRQYTNSNGEREADFIRCIAWLKTAEVMNKFLHKGSLIGIDGRIQTRTYENQQGNRVYVTEVVVDNFSLLESRGDRKPTDDQQKQNANQTHSNANQTNSDPFADNSKPIDISDDSLPF